MSRTGSKKPRYRRWSALAVMATIAAAVTAPVPAFQAAPRIVRMSPKLKAAIASARQRVVAPPSVAGVSRAAGDPAAAGMTPSGRDPGFDRFVDFAALGRAWDTLDAAGLADGVLALMEGERVLQRSFPGMPAGDVAVLAVRLAVENDDAVTLARLEKATGRAGDAKLAEAVAAAKLLGGRSRAADAPVPVDVCSVSTDQYRYCVAVSQAATLARVTGDATYILPLVDASGDVVLQPVVPPDMAAALGERVAAACADLPEQPAVAVDTLRILEAGSRDVFGDALKRARKSRDKIVDDAIRQRDNLGRDISRDLKQGVEDAGKLLEKPFRHAGENVKEGIFFAARDHVAGKNGEIGIQPRRFGPGDPYYEFIQPHLPAGVDFSQISFYFNAYVPQRMAGIAFGDSVYINSPFTGFDEGMLKLVAHETAHVLQYRRLSMKGFARRYMDDVFGGFMRYPNLDDVKIHDSIELEQQADEFADVVMNAYFSHEEDMADRRRRRNDRVPPIVRPQRQNLEGTGGQGGGGTTSDGDRVALLILQGLLNNAGGGAQQADDRQPRLGITYLVIPGRGGLVTSVTQGMPAARLGIRVHDIVVSIDGRPVDSPRAILDILRQAAAGGRREASVLVEDSRLAHLPPDERLRQVDMRW